MLGFLLCDNNTHVQCHAHDSCGNASLIQLKAQRFYLVYTAQKSSKVRSCPTLDWPIQNHMYFIKDVHCLVLEYQGMKGIFILKMALNSSSINICFTYCSRPKPCAFKPPWRQETRWWQYRSADLGEGQLRLTLHPSRPSQYTSIALE